MRNSRPLLFVIAIMIFIRPVSAQPNASFNDWGKVTMDELQMKECSFEKDADALLLLDLAQIDFSKSESFYTGSKFHVTTSYYQRYKIFTEKGLHRANFKYILRIQSKEEVKNIHAVSYNLADGIIKKTELKTDDIHTAKLNEYQEQVSFTIPDARPGTVFELMYERAQVVSYTLPGWLFNGDIPSITSSITVDFLDAIDYYVDKHVLNGLLEEKSVQYTSDIDMPSGFFGSKKLTGTSTTYTTHDLHSFHMEPYTNSGRNYTNWIGFQLRGFKSPLNANADVINSFGSFVRRTYDNVNFTANVSGSGVPKKEWKSLIKDGMSDREKAHAIFEFIRSNMKWNGNGGYIPKETNSTIWKNKTGSDAEINLLLVSTLRQAGLTVYPMLITSRAKGYVCDRYPILDDYIGVDAYVSLGGDSDLVLDATVKYLPFGMIPYAQLNTKGIVMHGSDHYDWSLITDRTGDKEFVSIIGDMDESGRLTGELTIFENNYAALGLINYKLNNQDAALNDWLKERIPEATIESVTDSEDVSSCRFYYKVKFSAQSLTDNDGNFYLSIPTIFGRSNNTFVNRERTSDVDMGYRMSGEIVMHIKIPDSFIIDSIVPSVSLAMEDRSITFVYQSELVDGIVEMRQKIDYRQFFYPVEVYPALYEFFQKYYTLKQKPVILRKKA